MNRYFIGALALIGLTILLVLILSTGHRRVPAPKPESLPNYANSNSEVSVDIAGPIVYPQKYNEASITVNRNTATFTLYQGYDGHVVSSKIFNNTENSYTQFLYALYYVGFEKTIDTTIPSNNGLCAIGNRYDLYLKNDGSVVNHTWATNCSGTPRSYGGNLGATLSLFESQIPELNTLIQGANL